MKTENGKSVTYGGPFGKRLITQEYYAESWNIHVSELIRLAETSDQHERIKAIREELRGFVEVNKAQFPTKAEAEAEGIPLHIDRAVVSTKGR